MDQYSASVNTVQPGVSPVGSLQDRDHQQLRDHVRRLESELALQRRHMRRLEAVIEELRSRVNGRD